MYTNGRLVEDARKIAENASSDHFLDIALQSAEETLAEYHSQEWPFAVGEGAVVTIAPYTTGAISFILNSLAVTGVGTTWLTNWPTPAILRPSDSSAEPLVVASFNSATSLTLDKEYPFASQPGLTYSLEFPAFPVSEYISISGVSIAQGAWRAPLRWDDIQTLLYRRTLWTPGAYPFECFLVPGDGTTSAKLFFSPAPSQVQTIRYRYTRAIPEFRCLIGGTDTGGTATLANAGTALTGIGTTFGKLGYSLIGHYFEVPDQSDIYSLVGAVGGDTSLTVGAWGGVGVTASPFYISPKILMPDNFRPMLRDLMRWKTFQNTGDTERAVECEKRYRRNKQSAWRSVNRMRIGREVKPVDLVAFNQGVEPPGMPWQLVMQYSP